MSKESSAGCGIKRLNQLRRGERGIIERIEGSGQVFQKLMALAFLPGAGVEVIGVAPFGDPIMVRLSESCISMRRRDAARIVVKL